MYQTKRLLVYQPKLELTSGAMQLILAICTYERTVVQLIELNTKISQGSAATDLRWDGFFSESPAPQFH